MKDKFVFVIALGVLLVIISSLNAGAVAPCRNDIVSFYSKYPEGCSGSICNSECKGAGYEDGGLDYWKYCSCMCYSYSGCLTCGIMLNQDKGESCWKTSRSECENYYEYIGGYPASCLVYSYDSGWGCTNTGSFAFFGYPYDCKAPECTTATQDVDCNDNNECTTDICTSGTCSHTNKADNTACGTNGKCKAGVCVFECTYDSDCPALVNTCMKFVCNSHVCEKVNTNEAGSCNICSSDPDNAPDWCWNPLYTETKDRNIACGGDKGKCSSGSCVLDTSKVVAAGYPWGACSGNLSIMCKERQCDGAGFCVEGNVRKFGKHPLCSAFSPPENTCKVNACNGNGECIPYRIGVYPGTEWPANYKTIVFPADSSATCSTWNSNGWWSSVQTLGLNDNAFSSGCCGIPTCPGGSVKVGTATYTYSCRSIADGCTGYNGYSGFYPTPYATLRCSSGTMCCYEITTGGGGRGGDNGFCPPFCGGGGGGGCGSGLTKCLDGSCKANCNEPIDAHSACLEGSCIAVPGEGPTGCTLDSDCSLPAGTHTICSSGKCISVLGSGNNQCSNDEQCFNPGINPVNPLLIHTECVNYECKIVSGAGENICSDDFRCPLPQWFLNISNGQCRMFAGEGENTCAITPGTITAMYWENLNGEKINKSGLRDNVYAVVGGLSSGQIVDYEIRRNVPGILGDDTAKEGSFTSSGNKDKIAWVAGLGNVDFNGYEQGIYHFRISLDNKASWKSTKKDTEFPGPYGELNVSEESNNPPNANIIGPKDKQIYFLNELLNFSANISDEDDNFNYTWDLGDGTIKTGNSINLLNYNFNYAYSTTGQKNIILSVNDERGEISRYMVSILIVNSSYILAYIDEPKWGEMVYGKIIYFNASSSYVVNLTHNSTGIKRIDCLAGPCPGHTEGCLPPANNYPDCQIQIPGTAQFPNPNWPGFENITFSWVFDDGSTKNKKGMAGAVFNKTFSTPWYHWGVLNASINPSGVIRKDFGNRFPYCDRNNNPVRMWDFFDNGEYTSINYDDDFYNCSKNNLSCCPPELEFSSCNKATGKCEPGPILCESFATPEECVADNSHEGIAFLALNKVLEDGGDYCGSSMLIEECQKSVDCLCSWNGVACEPNARTENTCGPGGDCYFDISTTGDCSQTSSVLSNWAINWGGLVGEEPAYCKPGQKSSPCPAQLDFVSEISIIIAILLISMIYLRIRWTRKK